MPSIPQVSKPSSPPRADRIRGAIWGQFVGDAACLGCHWIYDLAELSRRYPGGIQGFEAPAPSHYHHGKAPGEQTHYGDAALLLLESVAQNGRFDAVDFGRRFVALMASPDYHGYRDHATRQTLANYRAFAAQAAADAFDFQGGADDDQAVTATRLAPVVAVHAEDPRLPEIVAAATRVCQNNARAVAYMQCHARVLRALFDGRALATAFTESAQDCEREGGFGLEAAAKIRQALAAGRTPVIEATRAFGQSCPLVGSFPAAVHAALAHADDFTAAILATAEAGGENAGRAAMIGSWLGASLGIEAIPLAWRQRLAACDTIAGAAETIVARLVGG